MEKVEEYIEKYTKNCSNEYLTDSKPDGLGGYISRRKFIPWLTPEHARSVAEIAREETIKEVCELIRNNILEYCSTTTEIDIETFIYDIKKILEDKV